MSQENKNIIKNIPPANPGGLIKGIAVGDPIKKIKGSHIPAQQAPPPPPPPPIKKS